MRNFDLNNYGVLEMNAKEVLESNGGNQPIATYASSESCAAAGEAIASAACAAGSFVYGFFCGLLGV